MWEVQQNDVLVIWCFDCGNYTSNIDLKCDHDSSIPPILIGFCGMCVDQTIRKYMDSVTRHCPSCGGIFTVVLSGICHKCGYDIGLCNEICYSKPDCSCYREQRSYYVDNKPSLESLEGFV